MEQTRKGGEGVHIKSPPARNADLVEASLACKTMGNHISTALFHEYYIGKVIEHFGKA